MKETSVRLSVDEAAEAHDAAIARHTEAKSEFETAEREASEGSARLNELRTKGLEAYKSVFEASDAIELSIAHSDEMDDLAKIVWIDQLDRKQRMTTYGEIEERVEATLERIESTIENAKTEPFILSKHTFGLSIARAAGEDFVHQINVSTFNDGRYQRGYVALMLDRFGINHGSRIGEQATDDMTTGLVEITDSPYGYGGGEKATFMDPEDVPGTIDALTDSEKFILKAGLKKHFGLHEVADNIELSGEFADSHLTYLSDVLVSAACDKHDHLPTGEKGYPTAKYVSPGHAAGNMTVESMRSHLSMVNRDSEALMAKFLERYSPLIDEDTHLRTIADLQRIMPVVLETIKAIAGEEEAK